ncbi:MAG: hypothetical protein J5U17_03290 [Candidatus Methanoperedens sp.]|nr:hypothetical protein [Candidatus Methanoperedens sp.]MCE8424787.1 hypothetical protein [Candidatus Methanoperedens sp.]MCE8427079.1 hypothetical protein [Candidatus Methanoperedens sp.]
MTEERLKLGLMGLAGIIVLMYLSISTTFMILFLGFLLFFPALVIASVLKEGVQIITQQLHDIPVSGKNFFLISISKENIILEPQFR